MTTEGHAVQQAGVLETEIKDVTAYVAHRMRSPLWAMEGNLGTAFKALEGDTTQDLKRSLELVRSCHARLLDVAEGVEQLARVAHHACEWQPIDISALVAEVAAGVASRNKKRQVDVKIDPKLTAVGDPELMTTALTELLENAWKYTVPVPRAQVWFISAGNKDALKDAGLQLPEGWTGKEETSFAVLDNGVGFDQSLSYKLFCPFQRLHPPSEFRGAGMGLAIVRRIIHRHGGVVGARGEVGQGACFSFSLSSIRCEAG